MAILVYKILTNAQWADAQRDGIFPGAPVDLADGFVHLSAAHQVRETAAKHFSGEDGLVLAAYDAIAFGSALRWEMSRGGSLFPHLYAALDPAAAIWVKPLPLAADGAHDFTDLVA